MPVRLPGRESRLAEPALGSMGELLAAMVPALDPHLQPPYALFGHSMGGLIAFEVARHGGATARPPACLFVSGCRAPHLMTRSVAVHALSDSEMVERMLRDFGLADSTSDDELELMRLMAPTLRADMRLVETYQVTGGSPIDSPIVALGGARDPQVTRAQLEAWQSHTVQPVVVRIFPGTHFFLREQEAEIVRFIAERVH